MSQVFATSNNAMIAVINTTVHIPLHGHTFISLGRTDSKTLPAQLYKYLKFSNILLLYEISCFLSDKQQRKLFNFLTLKI